MLGYDSDTMTQIPVPAAIHFCYFNVNTFFVLKFLMQSYGVIEQETTKSPFFVSVICGGDTISATDSEHLDITVAKKRKPR